MSESTATLPTHIIEGLKMPLMFSADAFRSGIRYKPRPDDVFIVTYPKCGTTWAQHILLLLFSRGEPADETKFSSATPYLEVAGVKAVETMPRPGAVKTHLPFQLTPWSDQAKYIYITRNPKDCCVSYYHHMKNVPGDGSKMTFDEFFELFISGDVGYGDYFDHLTGWYEHRNDPNVLFMMYEEIQEDIEASILKIASFIDDEKYAEPLRKDRRILNKVLKFSSFRYMKEAAKKRIEVIASMTDEEIRNSDLPEGEMRKYSRIRQDFADGKEKNSLTMDNIRKGILGDWKNYFSEDQSRRLEEKFVEKTKGTELRNLWKNYM